MFAHADRFVGVHILASEYLIDRNGGGRIDAIGIDSSSAPVVLEFKRYATELTICQRLLSHDWIDHHGDIIAAFVLRR